MAVTGSEWGGSRAEGIKVRDTKVKVVAYLASKCGRVVEVLASTGRLMDVLH